MSPDGGGTEGTQPCLMYLGRPDPISTFGTNLDDPSERIAPPNGCSVLCHADGTRVRVRFPRWPIHSAVTADGTELTGFFYSLRI